MEKSEAIEFCKKHYINYNAWNDVLFSPEHALFVAVILYKASQTNGKSERWGHIYNGCIKSTLFPDLSVDKFWNIWTSVYPQSVGIATFRNGAYAVVKSFQRKGTDLDTAEHLQNRRASNKISDVLDKLVSPPAETI